MDRVLIDGKEYAAGLSWDVAEDGASKKSAIRDVAESFPDFNSGVIRVPKDSADAQVGLCDEALKGVKSAAAIFADAVDGVNSIGLFTCQSGSETVWWLVAVVDGFVVPGGDTIYHTFATAMTQVRDLRQIASTGHPVERFVVSDDLDTQVVDAEPVSFSDFAAGSGRQHEVRGIDPRGQQKKLIAAAVAVILLSGIGYYVYNSHGEALGIKEPVQTGKTPAQIKAELTRKSDGILSRGLSETAPFSKVSQNIIENLNNTPLFIAGWEVQSVTIDKAGNTSMPLQRVEGSIYSLINTANKNDWNVNLSADGDSANWSVIYPAPQPLGVIPELPDGEKIRSDLVNLFQLAGYEGYEFSEPAPIIRPNEIPKNVDFENPGYITKMTFNGDSAGDLISVSSVLSGYPTLRFEGLDVAVESGEYSKWTLKGELYEN